jgi:hypothetical protein
MLCAHKSLSGTCSHASSLSLRSFLVAIVVVSFLRNMPDWHLHLHVRQSRMAAPLDTQSSLQVEERMSPRYVRIVGQQQVYCVVGRLYSVQYKSIFGAPDKVRRNTGDQARPLSQV